jgi:hypothetical protein
MLVESRRVGRPLHLDERRLVLALARGTPDQAKVKAHIAEARVQPMRDGGMGSLRFCSPVTAGRILGRVVNEATFLDEDGVAVSASLNLDQDGALFELDLFKADGSPIRRIPSAAALTVQARALV